ncbi:hypothetical protein [Streptomyces sp. NPDC002845]
MAPTDHRQLPAAMAMPFDYDGGEGVSGDAPHHETRLPLGSDHPLQARPNSMIKPTSAEYPDFDDTVMQLCR